MQLTPEEAQRMNRDRASGEKKTEPDIAGMMAQKLGDEELGIEYFEKEEEESKEQIREELFDPVEYYRNHFLTNLIISYLPAFWNSKKLRKAVDRFTKTEHEYENLTKQELLDTGFPQWLAYCIDFYFPDNSWMNHPLFGLLITALSLLGLFMAKMKAVEKKKSGVVDGNEPGHDVEEVYQEG